MFGLHCVPIFSQKNVFASPTNVCGVVTVNTALSGTLGDDFTTFYRNEGTFIDPIQQYCHGILIKPEIGNVNQYVKNIHLKIKHLNINFDTQGFDVLDGSSSQAKLLYTFSDNIFPIEGIISSGPAMYLEFHSDHELKIDSRKFVAEYIARVCSFLIYHFILLSPQATLIALFYTIY